MTLKQADFVFEHGNGAGIDRFVTILVDWPIEIRRRVDEPFNPLLAEMAMETTQHNIEIGTQNSGLGIGRLRLGHIDE